MVFVLLLSSHDKKHMGARVTDLARRQHQKKENGYFMIGLSCQLGILDGYCER